MNIVYRYFCVNKTFRKMTDYSYLRAPPAAYEQVITAQDIICTSSGKRRRRLYEDIQYFQEEKEQIRKFREFARQQLDIHPCSDSTVLRYLYSFDFDFGPALEKLKVFTEWTYDPYIQNLNSEARKLIEEGAFYCFGRAKDYRPIIFMNVHSIDLDKHILEDYFCALNEVLRVTIDFMFAKGKSESYYFVIDLGGKSFSSLPFDTLIQIVKKLGVVYSMRMHKLLVLNVNTMIKMTYSAIKMFLSEETVRRISLFNVENVRDRALLEFIEPHQLEAKYGGSVPDILVHWPPQTPTRTKLRKSLSKTSSDSEYFSVINDKDVFEDNTACCGNSDCSIY